VAITTSAEEAVWLLVVVWAPSIRDNLFLLGIEPAPTIPKPIAILTQLCSITDSFALVVQHEENTLLEGTVVGTASLGAAGRLTGAASVCL
jgi:hypothetical protein